MREKDRDLLVVYNGTKSCWEIIDRTGKVLISDLTYEQAKTERNALETARAV